MMLIDQMSSDLNREVICFGYTVLAAKTVVESQRSPTQIKGMNAWKVFNLASIG